MCQTIDQNVNNILQIVAIDSYMPILIIPIVAAPINPQSSSYNQRLIQGPIL
jgi:hypothetical protein